MYGECSLRRAVAIPPTEVGVEPSLQPTRGTQSFQGSSDTDQHTVNEPPPPPPAATTTTITNHNPEPSDPGQQITVSFTVTSGSGTPGGTVTITDANGGGCTGSAPSGNCSYTPNGTGSRTISATYEGNSSFQGSSATEQHTVNEPPAQTISVGAPPGDVRDGGNLIAKGPPS